MWQNDIMHIFWEYDNPGLIPGIQTKSKKSIKHPILSIHSLLFKFKLSLFIIKYNKKRYLIMNITKEILEEIIKKSKSLKEIYLKLNFSKT